MNLFRIWADGQATDGMASLPQRARGPLASGKGGSAVTSEL
jgi:hypothetical protein